MTSPIAPLRIGIFRALWVASVFSNVGSFLQSVAASWLMLELTQSAAWVGLMAASTTLPLLFLALIAGAVADIVDRTKVMIWSQILMGAAAGAMAVLAVTNLITPGWLLALGLLLGTGVAFNLPAWQALVPDLVPRELVASAVALNSAAFNVARTVGPALGGLLIAWAGPAIGFGINAVSYSLVIGALLTIGRKLPPTNREATSVSNAIALGIRYARYTQPFRRLLLLAALFALISAAVQTVLPNLTQSLGGDETLFGLLWGAMGLGALLAAFTRNQLMKRFRGRSVPATVVGFGLAGIGLGFSPNAYLAAACMVGAGACWVWTLATLNATAQLMAPEWIRGRAMSLYSLAFVGILPLGAIISGWIADIVGPGPANVIHGVAGVVLGLVAINLRVPVLTEIATPTFTAPSPAPAHADTEGGPVMVLNTWVIDPAEAEEFVEVMNQLRLVRLRTGAYRWRLYRNAAEPFRMTEVFLTVDWEEHLAQHRRIDDQAADLIKHARSFDREGGPVTRHLVAVDVLDPEGRPDWDELVATHRHLHEADGSIAQADPN